MSKLYYAVPVYIIILGIAWLLNVTHATPKINWVATIGIAGIGVLVIFIFSLNKVTVVGGSLLIAASVCSFFEHIGVLQKAWEVPIIVILLGCLLLVVQAMKLPTWKS